MPDRSVHEQDSEILCSNRSSEEESCLLGYRDIQVGESQPTLTPWFYSASEIYRPSDRSLSAKLESTDVSDKYIISIFAVEV
jgi:hypothetical protein